MILSQLCNLWVDAGAFDLLILGGHLLEPGENAKHVGEGSCGGRWLS